MLPGQGRSQVQTAAAVRFPMHHLCVLWLSYPGNVALLSASVHFKTPGLLARTGVWKLGLFPVVCPRLYEFLQGPWRNCGPDLCHRFAIYIMNITSPASPGNEQGVTNYCLRSAFWLKRSLQQGCCCSNLGASFAGWLFDVAICGTGGSAVP